MRRRQFLGLLGGGAVSAVALAGGEPGGNRAAASPGQGNGPARDQADEIESPTSGLQRIIWSVDTDQALAALTFDDGPDPEFTPRILGLLGRYGVKSTFMVMGYNALRHPDLLAEIVAAGHEVASHTWSHRNLAEVTAANARTEIEYGVRIIEETAGVPVRLFRPPQGRLSEAAVRVLALMGHDIVLWSVTRGELGWTRPEQVAAHVADSVGPGDVVGLHDGIGRGTFNRGEEWARRLRRRRAVELDALGEVLERVKARRLRLGTMSELLAARRPIPAVTTREREGSA